MSTRLAYSSYPFPDASGVFDGHPAIGLPVTALPTPAPLIDLPTLERNIATMAAFFADRPAAIRPHSKTHRTPVVARMQVAAGAKGVTAPKTSVAEAMVDGGIDDVFVANQVVSPAMIGRLVALAGRARVSVLTDDARNVAALSEAAAAAGATLDVLVEIDGGMGRCGTRPGAPTVALAAEIARAPGLRFAGVHVYEGHLVQVPDRAERTRATEAMLDLGLETAGLIRRAGIDVETVTCGGTGTYDISGVYPGVTEHQAGSYVYMDPGYQRKAPAFGLAFSLLSTVLSTPSPDRVVVDSGLQVLSTGGGEAAAKGHPELALKGLSEEHGTFIRTDGGATGLRAGDLVEIHPGHCCAAANLHDTVYAVRAGAVEAVWAVTARGRSQ
ncbi:MAG: low-specificity D-threonine aldolase [uncultured Thermomicrobiales bacterium]|uniref:Low-specificity D-threonine aldolase n=1 Tax=uncultured Thermomicrobiales bacterium TaxID=1645740 RepID=A0A6J4UF79_9BACT|nr:MAG: low-specificity D-threonine aldolase [uncultured Thermomicrobiales bacterium]